MGSFSTTLSSAGNSAAANLDWRGNRPISASVTPASSSQTGDFFLAYTLDDLQSSSSPSWRGVSSAVGQAAQHFTSSQTFADGVLFTFTTPIAGLRVSSTASTGTLTLKVLQAEGP